MEWKSEGVIIANKKFIENKIITTVFTRDFGIKKGLVSTRKKSYTIEPGNIVDCQWSARLETHLGYLKVETITPITTFCLLNPEKLMILNSILSVLVKVLPENQEKVEIYQELITLLEYLKFSNDQYYFQYVKFDLCLLKNLGFELELNKCTVTQVLENLIYISPKTGKAVCAEVGEKYKDKLLKLPEILLKISKNKHDDF